jgi:hypothetical protein
MLVPVGLSDAKDIAGRFQGSHVLSFIGRVADGEEDVNDGFGDEPRH